MRTLSPTEDGLQQAIVVLLSVYEAQGRLRYFHVPNQLPRPKVLAAKLGMAMVNMVYAMIENKLKSLGKRKGVPDLVITFPNGTAAFWELKVGRNKPTAEQQDWLTWFDRSGFETSVIRDVADADLLLKRYLERAV